VRSSSSPVVYGREPWRSRAQDWADVAEQATTSETHTYRVLRHDSGAARNWGPRGSTTMWPSIAAGVIMALMVAAAGATLQSSAAPADLDAPVQFRVIESDLAEPFVACTTRAQVTKCREVDLRADRLGFDESEGAIAGWVSRLVQTPDAPPP